MGPRTKGRKGRTASHRRSESNSSGTKDVQMDNLAKREKAAESESQDAENMSDDADSNPRGAVHMDMSSSDGHSKGGKARRPNEEADDSRSSDDSDQHDEQTARHRTRQNTKPTEHKIHHPVGHQKSRQGADKKSVRTNLGKGANAKPSSRANSRTKSRSAAQESEGDDSSNQSSEEGGIMCGVVAHFASTATLGKCKDVRKIILEHGGEVLLRLTPRVNYLVASQDDYESHERKVQSATSCKAAIVLPELFVKAADMGELSKGLIEDYRLDRAASRSRAAAPSRATRKTASRTTATQSSRQPSTRGSSKKKPVASRSRRKYDTSSESGGSGAQEDLSEASDMTSGTKSDADTKPVSKRVKSETRKPASRGNKVQPPRSSKQSTATVVKRSAKVEAESPKKKQKVQNRKVSESQDEVSDDTMSKSEEQKVVGRTAKKVAGNKVAALASEEDHSSSLPEDEHDDEDKKICFNAEVDSGVPAASRMKVYANEESRQCFDAYLRLSDLTHNMNKYYIIQLLQSKLNKDSLFVWTRWGREGYPGQSQNKPYSNLASAIKEFETKFKAKCGNVWKGNTPDTMKGFKTNKGGYSLLELNHDAATSPEEDSAASPKREHQYAECQLEPEVKRLVELICDSKMMEKDMWAMKIDAKKLPLHKLSKTTILAGYKALREIEKELERASPRQQKLEELCAVFYTFIPHDVGFQKLGTFIIDTNEKLKSRLDMLDSLSQIERAAKVLDDKPKEAKTGVEETGVEEVKEEHPADRWFRELQTTFYPLDKVKDKDVYQMVCDYVENTHGKTHTMWKLSVKSIFEVVRNDEDERFEQFQQTENRTLLWHGSRLSNYVGIISQGLRIAPPEAPVTGYMFGKGVYFADMVTKSAQYCCVQTSNNTGILLLCEVALGQMNELKSADYNASELPPGKLSTKGCGRWYPDPEGTMPFEDGIMVPMGKPIETTDSGLCLMYNEYIVYNVDQICIRFLVEMNFGSG